MPHKLGYLAKLLNSSIWLIPGLCCIFSLLLGLFMLWLDRHAQGVFSSWQLFSMPVASARQVLSVIAGSVISVGGVTFSVTMVALTLTSGQYGPKVLRHFLEDNSSKISLGLFLGTYVYAIVLLSGYQASDQPHASVLVALLLTLFAILGFVYFIHSVATDLQADQIVGRIGRRLQGSLGQLVSELNDEGRSRDLSGWRRCARKHRPLLLASSGRGYVQMVDYGGLLGWSKEQACHIQVRVRAGDFVVPGVCLIKVYGCSQELVDAASDTLNGFVVTGDVRTAIQDAEYPITQLNQLAARALSPGINDPGTAISCVDSFSLALSQVIDRNFPGAVFLDEEGVPRLLVRCTQFESLLDSIFSQLRLLAKSELSVVISLYQALFRLAGLTAKRERLQLLGLHGNLIWEALNQGQWSDHDLNRARHHLQRLQARVGRLD